MATIEKRIRHDGRPAWRVRIRRRGRVISQTFSTKTLARRWAGRTELEIEEGRYFTSDRNRPVSELIERYTKTELGKLSPSSQRNRRRYLKWWKEQIGDVAVGERSTLRGRVREALEEFGETRSPATVNRCRAAMTRVFSMAATRWDWSEFNPFAGLPHEVEPQVRVRYLLEDEREELLQAVRESESASLFPFVLVALCTGARQGSIASLEWRHDVELERRRLIFRRTKNRKPVSAHVPEDLFEALRDWGSVRRIDSPLVFPKGFPRKGWETARTKAAKKVPSLADFRFHDLRHTFASYLAMSGTDLLRIQELLGHKTLVMVQKYAHLAPGHSNEQIDRMSEKFTARPSSK